ncbi:MAG: hypothetical protein V5A31_04310 [Haloferacaceae archaeon]|jgi:hypothetical protein
MRVRNWRDVLEDVTDTNADPDGWRAVGGRRADGVGEDLYVGHPAAGVFLVKTYARNPYEVKGVGTRVARKVDDGLDPVLPDREEPGRFAVRSPPEDEDEAESMARHVRETIKAHADAPTEPDHLFEDLMEAVESPAFGPMSYDLAGRPDPLDDLADEFEDAEQLLSAELDDLVEEDEVDRGFQ